MTRDGKVVLWDIETSLGVFATFGLYPNSIPYENILEEPQKIICISWKYLGEKKVTALHTAEMTEKEVIEEMSKVLSGASLLIHHNGDKFDLKKFTVRLIKHGLPALPPVRTLDTLKELKRVASFACHRLDFLGDTLGIGRKKATGKGLWLKALHGDPDAIKEMSKYCNQDVRLLESLYLTIRPYLRSHPNLHTENGCNVCGSDNTINRGYTTKKGGLNYQKFQCKDCGSWGQGTTAVNKIQSKPL